MAKNETTDAGELIEDYSRQFPKVDDVFIPTRYLAFDHAFGGGLPVPRTISLTADFGVGKTTAVLCLTKSVLEADPENIVVFLDAERGLSENTIKAILGDDYAERYANRFVVLTPRTYEESEKIINDFAKTNHLKLVIFDSLTFLQPQKDLDKAEEGENTSVAGKSAAENKFCPRMKFLSCTAKFSIIYINQRRANFGGGSWSGPMTKMSGSNALLFSTDYIVNMRNVGSEKNLKGEKVGATIQIVCEKNRIVGNRIAYAFIRYGVGISNTRTIAEFFKWAGIVKQGGAFFTFTDEGFDFGAGLGQPIKVQGLKKCEDLVAEKLSDIITYYSANGKLTEFFNSYVFK